MGVQCTCTPCSYPSVICLIFPLNPTNLIIFPLNYIQCSSPSNCHYSTPTLSGVFPQNLYLVTCPPKKKHLKSCKDMSLAASQVLFLSRISCTGPLRRSWSAFLLRQTHVHSATSSQTFLQTLSGSEVPSPTVSQDV